jgi:uncharacterized protein YndB with AHSA1/START domain
MATTETLKITTPSDREITMTRVFDAPRRLVFEAYTKPELLKRWLGVFGGWSLDVCVVDLKVGGGYEWGWRNTNGKQMRMVGTYREVVVPERIVATEVFDDPWYEGTCIVTTEFAERAGKTTMKATMRYDSKKIRDAVIASPMESGVAKSYDNLEEVLKGLAAD